MPTFIAETPTKYWSPIAGGYIEKGTSRFLGSTPEYEEDKPKLPTVQQSSVPATKVQAQVPSTIPTQTPPAAVQPPTVNEHWAYLEKTWPGGAQAYIASQQQRYIDAVTRGDTDLVQRLIADAARVGYSLPNVPTRTNIAPVIPGVGTAPATQAVGSPGYYDETTAKALQALVDLALKPRTATIPDEVQQELAFLRQQYQQLINTPKLTWQEAQARAQAALDPLYRQQLSETLKEVERNLIRRGFFGQLPSVPVAQDVAARIENARATAIANLANQLAGQSEEAARWATQMALQTAQGQLGNILSALEAGRQQQQQQFSNLVAIANLVNALRQQQREQEHWEREFPLKEAAVTWLYKGQPIPQATVSILDALSDLISELGLPQLSGWLSTIYSYLAP